MAKRKAYDPPGLAPASPRYSHVVSVSPGRTIFIAGQTAVDSAGRLVGRGDLQAQIEQVFKNLEIALKAEGARFDDVVKLNIYVIDMDMSLPLVQKVRSKYIQKEPPASTLVGVTRLADPNSLVEIEAVAALD